MAGVNYPKWTRGETTTWKRTVDEDIIFVTQAATPILGLVSPGLNNLPKTCEHTKYEWMEDELNLLASKVGNTAGDATTPTPTGSVTASDNTFYVNFAEGEYFLAGHILQCEDELMMVTTAGTSADVIVVVRGYSYSSAAAHAAGSTVKIVSRAHNEGGAPTTDTYGVATMPYNYTQIWQQQFEFTSTEQAITRYGDVARFDRLEAMTLKNLMTLMERSFLEGGRVERTTRAAIAETVGSSGGLLDTTAAYVYASNINPLSGAALTRSDVLDLLQEIYDMVGVEYMPTTILCNSWAKRKLNDFFEVYVQTERTDRTGGAIYDRILTDFGELDIVMCTNVRADHMHLIHIPFCAIGPLKGEEFRTVELAQTTALMTEYQIVGEYTQMIKNPKCHGRITGFSTST